jgi:hypothetical protein
LLAGFTRGQLQPRITASWEPQQASRAKGERGGMALDVCCFMKGLETVERER